jgi:hypothetical protein
MSPVPFVSTTLVIDLWVTNRFMLKKIPREPERGLRVFYWNLWVSQDYLARFLWVSREISDLTLLGPTSQLADNSSPEVTSESLTQGCPIYYCYFDDIDFAARSLCSR